MHHPAVSDAAWTLFGRIAALDAFGLLAFSGVSHAVNLRRLYEDMQQQALLPGPGLLLSWVVYAVTGMELGTAAVGLAGVLDTSTAMIRSAALIAAVLYAGFAAYAIVLLRTHPDAPCGCGSGSEPVNVWTAARAAVLSMLAVWTAVGAERVHLAAPGTELAVALLAAVALGTMLWCLPPLLDGRLVLLRQPGHYRTRRASTEAT